MKPPTRARQDYVKAMFALGGDAEVVSTSHLAARLAVSMPSATNMLRKLASDGLVVLTPGTGARLSAAGRRMALDLVRRHRILETFLQKVLGLDWADVHEDAEVLEHHISDRVLEAIDRLIGHPSEDPHGHMIPDRDGRMRRRTLAPLTSLAAGARGTVREIRDDDRARMAHWKKAGLIPGAEVRVREVRDVEDIYEIEVAGRRLLSGSEGLDGVMVEPHARRRPS
ncbi:MAG: metal-dependent transcriptional regulator [Candidatus Eisenbacteria bacterium]